MSNMGDLYPSSTQPESNSYSNEDFEKVDPGDLDQQPAESERDQLSDQVPTSTAFSGEEAEEDRYGSWMKNVDPREPGETIPVWDDDRDQLPVIEESPATQLSSEPGEAAMPGQGGQPSCSLCSTMLLDLVYWQDVKKTGVVFGSMMFLLLSLAFFSVLSVVAYLSLATLTITLSFRVYKNVLQAVQKTGDQHPFKQYLDMDINLPEEKVQLAVENIVKHVNNTSREVRRLFLVEDLVDSIKFGLFLWVLTYIGAWFNGMTIIILGVVTIFTLPKFYETYKTQIDNYLHLARTNINKVLTQIKSKIPFPKKKDVKKE
ncbi:reticulon-1-A-like isoform X2 [Liolophura sinensis]|uniref:reticulon-1-A-like isoform X2 n=1 Tax=Liolophura sinensis TaxID=3198878 RepID=UPI003159743D